MIEDRDYMRQPEFGGSGWRPRFQWRWSLTVGFIIAYAVIFVLELFPPCRNFFQAHLALTAGGLTHGYLWQLVTYQFMHDGFWHLFFNCWAIYVFGNELELQLGRARFTALMLSSGIIGGLFQVLLTWLMPRYFPDSFVVGASACGYGLVAAYAGLFPKREFSVLVFFVIPIAVTTEVILGVSAVMAAAGVVVGIHFPSHIANAAHLGGMVMGWIFVRYLCRGGLPWGEFSFFEKKSPARATRPEPAEPAEDTVFLQNQVDAILDKINAQGVKSLTKREREILETAGKKMGKS